MTEQTYMEAIRLLEEQKAEIDKSIKQLESQKADIATAESELAKLYKGKTTDNAFAIQAADCGKCQFKDKCKDLSLPCRCKIHG